MSRIGRLKAAVAGHAQAPGGYGAGSIRRFARRSIGVTMHAASRQSMGAKGLAILVLGFVAAEWIAVVSRASPASVGVDLHLYQGYVRSYLEGGSLYAPWQLSGPYEIRGVFAGQPIPLHPNPSLYPPLIVLLVAPFLVLPEVLWWAIPISVIAYVFWRLRPPPAAWMVIGALLAFPRTIEIVLYGNPALWCVAALAASTVWRGASILVVLKPTLAMFAVVGVHSRAWWAAAGALIVASLALGDAWAQWLVALTNVRGSGLAYSLPDVVPMMVPIAGMLRLSQKRVAGPFPVRLSWPSTGAAWVGTGQPKWRGFGNAALGGDRGRTLTK